MLITVALCLMEVATGDHQGKLQIFPGQQMEITIEDFNYMIARINRAGFPHENGIAACSNG